MNNLIAIKKATTGSYAAMSSTAIVASGTLVAINVGGSTPDVDAVLVEGLAAADVALPLNVAVRLVAVDLSTIRVKTHPSGVACDVSFVGHSGRP